MVLNRPGYPLEHYDAIGDCELIDSVRGTVSGLPALLLYRPRERQLVVSISGTASLRQALHDLRVTKTAHPSGHGAAHSGFWALYCGIKGQLMVQIRHEIEKRHPAALILTGHSMGGSLAYLLLLDLLSEELSRDQSKLSALKIYIAVMAAPRTGDEKLVDYFQSLLLQFREKFKLAPNFLTEYSIQGYSDGMLFSSMQSGCSDPFDPQGIPAVPPRSMGYRHFCRAPLFTGGGKLYRIPTNNQSQVMFYPPENMMKLFPMGGHNYYNRRDLESFRRRTSWLAEADIDKTGWQSRYETTAGLKDPSKG